MPKLKTKQKTAKRFRVTKNGKVLALRPSGRRHLLVNKETKNKRDGRQAMVIEGTMGKNIKQALPWS